MNNSITEAIEVISDKLGIAVQSAADIIEVLIPEWAAMKIASLGVGTFFGLLFIGIGIFIYKRYIQKAKECDEKLWLSDKYWVVLISSSAIIILGIIVAALAVAPLLQWLVAPNAMFAKEILSLF